MGTSRLTTAGMVPFATDGKAQLAILRVTRVLVETAAPTQAQAEVPEWVRRLISFQARVHERIGASGDARFRSRAARSLEGCLRSRPHLLEVYLDVLTADDRSGDCLVALSAVTSFALSRPLHKGELIIWL